MDEISIDVDRRTVEKKSCKVGFASSSAPKPKEEKMLGVLGWVGSLRLQEQIGNHLWSCQEGLISFMALAPGSDLMLQQWKHD